MSDTRPAATTVRRPIVRPIRRRGPAGPRQAEPLDPTWLDRREDWSAFAAAAGVDRAPGPGGLLAALGRHWRRAATRAQLGPLTPPSSRCP